MAANEPAAPGAPSADGNLDSQQWAIQRRIDDVFAKLGEKFGDLTGRVVVRIKPNTTFAQIGGLREAKSIVRSFATALTDPELYRKWGITPPKGVLLYERHLQVRPKHGRAAPGDPGGRQGAG